MISMSKYTVSGPSRIPWRVWLDVLGASVFSATRSPHSDGKRIWDSLRPPAILTGAEHLPAEGPYVVVANHFNGPGIWVGLPAALIAYAVGMRTPAAAIRGVGVAAYRDYRLAGVIPIPEVVTSSVFARFYGVYDIILMPPKLDGPRARSAGVRRILGALRCGDVVILFPEGQNVVNFTMRTLQPGVGHLLRLAAKLRAAVVPAAVAHSAGAIMLSFGPPIEFSHRAGREEIESLIGSRIARMLPAVQQGAYACDHATLLT